MDQIPKRPLAGFIEAIGEFNRPEAIPYLIDAMADDMCRSAAEKALRRVYRSARSLLIETVLAPLPAPAYESASSLHRRRSTSRLLAGGGIPDRDWPALVPLLDEKDPFILMAISSIGAEMGSAKERGKIANRLLDLLPGVEWSLQDEIENLLVICFQEAKTRFNEISSHRSALRKKPVWDPVLQALLRIKRKAEEGNHDS